MDSAASILRSAKHFFFGTLLSRFSGLIRDIAMAFCFGSTPEVAAFMVAYRLANLFRRLFGEGNVAAGFVPLYVHHRETSVRDASLFYRDAAWSMGLLLIGAVLGIEVVFWCLRDVVGEGWREIVNLSMWMAPGLFFICLFALHTALLQCQRKAFWPGVAPVAFNFAWIAVALISKNLTHLALGITVAYGMQWLLTGWQVQKDVSLGLDWFRPRLFSSEWRAMIRPMTLGLVGIGALQINSALDAIFARIADPSGPAFLWYAIRIQQLPLALFGIALSGALLPPLSRAMKEGNLDKYRDLLSGSYKNILALMIPCTFCLFALAHSGLNLLYGHGDFSPADVDRTAQCLFAYGIGLLPGALVLILAQGLYAKKDYTLPAYGSVIAVVVNTALNSWLVFGLGWGAPSIALATSISAFANYLFLARALSLPSLFSHPLFRRLTLICGAAACASLWVQQTLLPQDSRFFPTQLMHFAVSALIYGGTVLLLARRLQVDELFALLRRKERA